MDKSSNRNDEEKTKRRVGCGSTRRANEGVPDEEIHILPDDEASTRSEQGVTVH